METLKNIIWLIILLFTPLMILIFGIRNFLRKEKLTEILLRSSVALTIYLISTGALFLILMLIFFSSGSGDPISGDIEYTPFGIRDLIGLISILGYFCIGLYLCWFVKKV